MRIRINTDISVIMERKWLHHALFFVEEGVPYPDPDGEFVKDSAYKKILKLNYLESVLSKGRWQDREVFAHIHEERYEHMRITIWLNRETKNIEMMVAVPMGKMEEISPQMDMSKSDLSVLEDLMRSTKLSIYVPAMNEIISKPEEIVKLLNRRGVTVMSEDRN